MVHLRDMSEHSSLGLPSLVQGAIGKDIMGPTVEWLSEKTHSPAAQAPRLQRGKADDDLSDR